MKSKKVFYFDVETTGTNQHACAIIQLAYIIEIDGKVVEQNELRIRPHEGAAIENEALAINGFTKDEIKKWEEPKVIHKILVDLLTQYVDPYNREDKFTVVGYNVGFDMKFLSEFFKRCGDKYFGSLFSWYYIDIFALAKYIGYKKEMKWPDFKLVTLCKEFKINIKAHDALSDIVATRELMLALDHEMNKEEEIKNNESISF